MQSSERALNYPFKAFSCAYANTYGLALSLMVVAEISFERFPLFICLIRAKTYKQIIIAVLLINKLSKLILSDHC